MKRFLLTVLTTVTIMTAGTAGYLVTNGNITFEKVDTDHKKEVYLDGVLVEAKEWNDILGYNVEIHFNDHAYIGK